MDELNNLLHQIPRISQRQDSLSDQLKDLCAVANRIGMYDAADYLNTRHPEHEEIRRGEARSALSYLNHPKDELPEIANTAFDCGWDAAKADTEEEIRLLREALDIGKAFIVASLTRVKPVTKEEGKEALMKIQSLQSTPEQTNEGEDGFDAYWDRQCMDMTDVCADTTEEAARDIWQAALSHARKDGWREPDENTPDDALDAATIRRIREYLALSHEDGKCHIYGDDGELQCCNSVRHGRTVDFAREPISDLLNIIIETRMREYYAKENQGPPPEGWKPL